MVTCGKFFWSAEHIIANWAVEFVWDRLRLKKFSLNSRSWSCFGCDLFHLILSRTDVLCHIILPIFLNISQQLLLISLVFFFLLQNLLLQSFIFVFLLLLFLGLNIFPSIQLLLVSRLTDHVLQSFSSWTDPFFVIVARSVFHNLPLDEVFLFLFFGHFFLCFSCSNLRHFESLLVLTLRI